MALSITRLKNAIATGLNALYTTANMYDNRGNRTYTNEQIAQVIATSVINEFTGHAQCNGLDSNNDTHNLVGII